MNSYQFSENQDLNSLLNRVVSDIEGFSESQLNKIRELNQIGMALSAERDLKKLLNMILFQARRLTNADAGTLYLKDEVYKKLNFEVIQNDSFESDSKFLNSKDWNSLSLFKSSGEENREMVAVLSFLTGKTINIEDVYNVDGFNFEGTKKFDKKSGYRSKSMFVVPMKNFRDEIIGVVQLLNKKSKDGEIIPFNRDDEEITLSLSSQAAISITRSKQEELLIRKSKMAAICEMIDAIAHQWRQPLNLISLYISNLPLQYELGQLNLEKLNRNSESILNQIEHLNITLDEFRNFFRPNKAKVKFGIRESIDRVFSLIKDDLDKNQISTEIDGNYNLESFGFPNEFKHIILNIINNSKDAFNEKNKKTRTIKLNIDKFGDRAILSISDNAGGIDESIIDCIFEPNFTTKGANGTGVGLYMSKIIADNMNFKIDAKNIYIDNQKIGVKFSIEMPLFIR